MRDGEASRRTWLRRSAAGTCEWVNLYHFRFTSAADSGAGVPADTITNFDAGIDTFTFSGIAVAGGHIDYVGTGPFTGLGASAHLESFGPGNDLLQIDIDGDGLMTSNDMAINPTNLAGSLSNFNFLP